MDFLTPFQIALTLLANGDPELMSIIGLSLTVSMTAVATSLLIGLPLGAILAAYRFPGRTPLIAPLFQSLGLGRLTRIRTLVFEARATLLTIALVCFGRAISEVGAVMIVGGNIRHSTRVMTTSIALATSMGELAFAMALGIVLLLVALVVNIASQILRNSLRNFGHDV